MLATVDCLQQDLLPAGRVLQKAEVSIAMSSDDRIADAAGRRAAVPITRAERQAASGRVRQHIEVDVCVRNLQPGNGPGICPRPGTNFALAGEGARPSRLDQFLCEPSLRMDVESRAELPKANGSQCRDDSNAHG